MRKIFSVAVLALSTITAFAQLANWQPVAAGTNFPTNLVGQINGYARISQMKFHTTNPGKMYAITGEGGLFTTTDGGVNWVVAPGTDKLTGSCASVCIDYTNDQTLWVGTGDANYYTNGQGLYKSTDGGQNFTATTLTNCLVLHILQNPLNSSEYVAATNKGIYKSTNGGITWVAKTSTSIEFVDLVANPGNNSQTLFACTRENAPRFYKSIDYGNTWMQSTTGITAAATNITAGARIGVTPADTSVVYFEVIGGGGIIHKSNDGGITFTVKKAAGSPYITFYSDDPTSSTQGNYNNCIWIDNSNPAKIWLQSHNTWLSTDSGATWTMLTFWSTKVHTDMHQVQQSPYDNSKLYSCNDGGIWISSDGGNTWVPKCNGLYAYEIATNAGISSLTKKDFVSIGTQDNARLYGNESGWFTISGGDDYAKRQFDYNGNIYFDGTNRQLNHTGANVSYNLPTLNWTAFGFNRKNKDLGFMGTKDSIFRCTNLSATSPSWSSIAVFNPASLTVKDVHSCIADPNRLYVLLTNGNIMVSTNALSASPTFTSYTVPGTAGSTGSVIAMANNADIVYIAENTKVYRSQNGGVSWTDVTYNLPAVNHRRIVSEEYGGTEELVFVGTNNAVYYKKAGQNTWTNYSTNLPARRSPTEISLFDDSTGNARIRYATYGRAIWETPFTNLRTTQVNFTWDNANNICNAGNSVSFTDLSTGNITSWNWTFAGGTPSTSTQQNPVVSFSGTGSFLVTLTVSDGTTSLTKTGTVLVIGSVTAYTGCTVAANSNNANGFGIGIGRFSLGSIDNSTSSNDGPYNNYACTKSTQLELNTSYSITVKTGTFNNEGARVFIDYNSNGAFEPGESVATFAASTAGERSVTFTTPASGVTMNKALRLRVLSRFNAIPSATNACDVSTYGQAEDYTVYFKQVTPPSVSCSATNNTNCFTPNGTVTATASNVNYFWSNGATTASIGNLTAGSYTVTVTDILSGATNTCTATVTNIISNPSIPAITATASSICSGNSVALTISSGDLNGASGWQWYTGGCGGVNVGSGTSITVSPSATTTFFVRGEGGCITPGPCASITINVNNGPSSAVLSGSNLICTGGSTNLQVAITNGNSPFTVVHTGGTVSNYISGNSIAVSPLTTTTYTLLSVTDANGCTTAAISGNAVITVSPNTFTGTGNWTDNARWSCGAPPSPADQFQIGNNANAILNTNFTIGGTLNMLPGSKLDIAPGKTLSVSGTANFAGEAVTFLSTAAGYGSLGPVTGTINGGSNVTVERYIPNNGFRSWRLLSVPTFGSQTINGSWQENNAPGGNSTPGYGTQITGPGGANGLDAASSTSSMLKWNGTAWEGVNNTQRSISTLSPYNAFFVFVRGERTKGVTGTTTNSSPTTLRTKGSIYTGNQVISIPANSFTLVPNLYPSAIDFTLLTRAGVKDLFYIWDSKKQNGSSLGAYQTFSATNGYQCLISGGSYTFGEPNTTIESGQAFFVEGGTGAGTITLKEVAKINGTSGNMGLRPMMPDPLKRITTRLISNSAVVDANAVVFNLSYSNAVGSEDAAKYSNPGENLALWNNNRRFAIEGREPVTDGSIINFSMWNMNRQRYSLEILPENMLNDGLTAVLEDDYLKTSIPVSMSGATNIVFDIDNSAASAAENRFRLVFARQKAVSMVRDFKIAPNPVTDNTLNIQFINQPAGKYSIQLISSGGQLLKALTVSHAGGTDSKTMELPLGLARGQYEVKITAPDNSGTVIPVMNKPVN